MNNTVFVVDRDKGARGSIRRALERGGYDVREHASGSAAVDAALADCPRVVVLDVDLPDLNGYEVCRLLRDRFDSQVAIVFVSGLRSETFDRTAGLLVGADDYLAKPFDASELLARVRRLSREHLDESAAPGTGLSSLTAREREVLLHLADGMTAAEIAELLSLSPKTVATHVQRVLAKLNVRNRAQAVGVALRAQLAVRA